MNTSDPTINLLDESNPNIFQLRLAHMMANAAATASTGQNNDGSNPDAMMNTLANIQRNFLLKILSNPMAAVQAAQAAATATQIKASTSPMASNNKQLKSSRKRKSIPEKRVVTNHRSTNNNDDVYICLKKNEKRYCFFFYLDISNY